MKHLITIVALLFTAGTFAQSNGDPAFFYYVSPGIKDSKTYASLINDGLFATNNVGGFGLIAKSSFLTPAQGNAAYSLLGHVHAAGDITSGTIATARLGSGAANNTTFLRGDQTWQTISAGSGDVVGPASSTNNNVPQWDGVTGKLLKDGLATSIGGNGATDAGKVALFNPEGQLVGSSVSSGLAALTGTSTGNGTGLRASSATGYAGQFFGNSTIAAAVEANNSAGIALASANNSATLPSLEAINIGAGPHAHFHGLTGLGMQVLNDGGLNWTSATGAQTTATAIPAFGTATKGVVPASGGGTSNFLRADGTFAAPAGTAGITSLTGDVTGTGPGATASTLATVNGNVGSFGSATQTGTFTVNGKGLITAAANATISPAVGSITGLGTGVSAALSSNVGTAGAFVVNGGALGTPSSGVATNLTGTASGLSIGGNAATVTTNANLTGPITSVGNATTISDAELAAIAGLTSAADKGIQFTGSGTAATYDLTAAGKALLDDASTTAQRITLGNVQQTAYKSSTTSRVNNTLTADPDLQIALAASQKISGMMNVYITGSAAGDFKYRITGPAGFNNLFIAAAWFTSGTVTTSNLTAQAYDAADRTAVAAADFIVRLNITFIVDNGATPGTFQLEWAQNTTAAGNASSVLVGSQVQYVSF